MTPRHWHAPRLSLRFVPVWRRHFLVWRKLALPSVLGNLADPVIYLFGLGFGIGMLVPEVAGVPYVSFLAAGMVCYATMNSASFEALYSSFSRMHVQKTWDAILNAPLDLDDIVTPMTLLSGVFFPVEQLPPALRAATDVLPLKHAVELTRPLLLGEVPHAVATHLAVLVGYFVAALWLAVALARRRLLK